MATAEELGIGTPGSAGVEVSRPGQHQSLKVLCVLCVALFMVFLDNTVVGVGLPTIQRDLHAGVDDLQWVIDAYTLFFACFLLTAAVLGDAVGHRRVFVAGLTIFTLASAACAMAPTSQALLVARAAQGLGGSIVMPVSLSILSLAFGAPKQRARAIGVWSGIGSLALAAGPLVGGLLVESHGWQSVFWINVPLGLAAVAASLVVLPAPVRGRSRRFDFAGQAMFVLGIGALTLCLIEGNKWGWSSLPTVLGFGAAATLIGGFLVSQLRARDPLFPVRLLRNSAFALPNLVGLVAFFGLFAVIFLLTLYWQSLKGFSPVETGIRFLPLTVTITLMSPLAAVVASRVSPRLCIAIGSLLTAAGLAGLTHLDVVASYSDYAWALVILGIGVSFAVTPGTILALGLVDESRTGTISGVLNTCRQLGGVLGVAALGAVMIQHFQSSLLAGGAPTLIPSSFRDDILRQLSSGDLSGIQRLPAAIRGPLLMHAAGAFVEAVRLALAYAAALNAAVGVGVLLWMLVPRIGSVRVARPDNARRRPR